MAKFKRTVAATLAVIGVLGTLSIGAYASTSIETETFKTRHINSHSYIPSEVNYPAVVNLKASSDDYWGVMTSMSGIANRSATVTCTSHTIYDRDTVVFNNVNKPIDWHIEGDLNVKQKATYNVKAHTDLYTALEVEGYIARGTYNGKI